MVSIDKAVTAKITKSGISFEILVDPILAMDFKQGKEINIEKILAVNGIFKDASKGERSSAVDLVQNFKTTDVFKIAENILKEGDVQITTEQKRKLIAAKKLEIANIISKQGVDPKTKLPHPSLRIMNAMEEAHVRVDAFKPAKDQVEKILTAIQEIIPISVQRVAIAIKIPIQYAGKASSTIRKIVKIKKEEWKSNFWFALVEIPAGMRSEIYEKLNDLTAGSVEVKEIE